MKNRLSSCLILYSFPVICLTIVALFHLKTGIAIRNFMSEPQSIVGVHPFVGAISNLGVLFWCATAAILLFSWSIRPRTGIPEKNIFSFFLYAGLLTIILTIDDLFMVHDAFLPTYCGIKEIHSYIFYVIAFFFGFIIFKKQIISTKYVILVLALAFWGLSVMFDLFQPGIEKSIGGNWRILLEDGFKFLGIIAWFDYFTKTCISSIEKLLQTEKISKTKKQKKR